MKIYLIAVGGILFLASLQASAQPHPTCGGPQLGTWKLESYVTQDLTTGQKTPLFGLHPSGYLSYGADCRMSAILIKEGRKPPSTFVPTNAERIDLYNGFIAYAGTYRIEGDTVSHLVDASWNQSWTGTTQVRTFKIDGNTLSITTLPTKNALTGRQSTSLLVWTKVE